MDGKKQKGISQPCTGSHLTGFLDAETHYAPFEPALFYLFFSNSAVTSGLSFFNDADANFVFFRLACTLVWKDGFDSFSFFAEAAQNQIRTQKCTNPILFMFVLVSRNRPERYIGTKASLHLIFKITLPVDLRCSKKSMAALTWSSGKIAETCGDIKPSS